MERMLHGHARNTKGTVSFQRPCLFLLINQMLHLYNSTIFLNQYCFTWLRAVWCIWTRIFDVLARDGHIKSNITWRSRAWMAKCNSCCDATCELQWHHVMGTFLLTHVHLLGVGNPRISPKALGDATWIKREVAQNGGPQRWTPKWIGDEVERLKNNVMLMCVGEVVVWKICRVRSLIVWISTMVLHSYRGKL